MKKLLRKENLPMVMLCMVLLALTTLFVVIDAQQVSAEAADGVSVIENTDNPTLFGRIWAWVVQYKETIVLATGVVVSIVTTARNSIKQANATKTLTDDTEKANKNITLIGKGQNDLIKTVNELIVAYNKNNELMEKFAPITNLLTEFKAAIESNNESATTILYILSTVYANSKNVPQGTKDLITLAYANVLKQHGNNPATLPTVGGSDDEENDEGENT